MADQFEKATLPVKDKNCSHAPRMGSSLIVSKDGKDYTVSLPSDDCFDIEVGKQVQLLYNNNLDYFVVPGHNKVYTIRLISSSLVLFLCCIPWRFLRRKY